jgi:hypothetical protein
MGRAWPRWQLRFAILRVLTGAQLGCSSAGNNDVPRDSAAGATGSGASGNSGSAGVASGAPADAGPPAGSAGDAAAGGSSGGISIGMAEGGISSSLDGGTRLGCDPQTIHIASTAGQALERHYEIISRRVFDASTNHNLPLWGSLHLIWDAELSLGESARLTAFDLDLPRDDADLPSALLCGTGGRTTRLPEAYVHEGIRVAEVTCPGTPVEGNLLLSSAGASGTVDGVQASGAVTNVQIAPGALLVGWQGARLMRVQVDDPGVRAASGAVVGGRFAFVDGRHYCVGGGTFNRPDPSNPEVVELSLTQLSRVKPCEELPQLAIVDVCVADEWQTSR